VGGQRAFAGRGKKAKEADFATVGDAPSFLLLPVAKIV
jgi:hypothetical protein